MCITEVRVEISEAEEGANAETRETVLMTLNVYLSIRSSII